MHILDLMQIVNTNSSPISPHSAAPMHRSSATAAGSKRNTVSISASPSPVKVRLLNGTLIILFCNIMKLWILEQFIYDYWLTWKFVMRCQNWPQINMTKFLPNFLIYSWFCSFLYRWHIMKEKERLGPNQTSTFFQCGLVWIGPCMRFRMHSACCLFL